MISFSANETFLVTGASSGIGEAVALTLNRLGASVVGVGRDAKRLERLAAAACPERMHTERFDLAKDVTAVPDFVRVLREKYGRFAGLAHCAGAGAVRPLPLWNYADERALFDIDYFAPMALLRGIADARNNIGEGTACVVVASAAARLADRGHASYAGAKAALVASCRAAAKELAPRRVRVNTISPTAVKTPMLGAGDLARAQEARYPMGFGEPSDVAGLAAFLLSRNAKWITGQDYIVDCASF